MKDEDKTKVQLIEELALLRQWMAALEAPESEHKRAEEGLGESKESFQVAFKNSSILVSEQDRKLHYTWVYNPHDAFSVGEILGKSDAELLEPEDAAPLTQIKRRVLENGIGKHSEIRVTIEGEVFFYDLIVEPKRNSTGNVIGLSCTATDITARKQREEALREAHNNLATRVQEQAAKLAKTTTLLQQEITERKRAEQTIQAAHEYAEAIVDTVREPLLALDVNMQVVTANRAFYQTFKVAPEETEGRLLYDLGNQQWDIPKLRELLEAILPSNSTFDDYEVEHDFETLGRRSMLLNARRLYRETKEMQMVLLAIEDITERNRTQEALQAAQEQLLEQQQQETERVEAELGRVRHQLIQQTRLATIGQISASIAHELRNPLGSIRNAVYLLKRRAPAGDPKWTEYLGIVEEEVNSSDRIISNLMEMTRGKEPNKRTIDLAQIMQEAYSRAGAPQGIRWQCSFAPDPFVVWGDATQLRQVFGNLILNAIQAMDGHGALTVSTSRSPEHDTITIQDTGPGVAPEHRQRIFEPLFTAKAKGTGLGLTICRQIIERHGGTIELMDNGASGATFCVWLPRQHQHNHLSERGL